MRERGGGGGFCKQRQLSSAGAPWARGPPASLADAHAWTREGGESDGDAPNSDMAADKTTRRDACVTEGK